MHCDFFNQKHCLSCSLADQAYDQQIALKDQKLKTLFAKHPAFLWLPPVLSNETQFRNKAKMVVLGAAHAPILGIETPIADEVQAVSLVDCPLYPSSTRALLAYLQNWIRIAGITPYNKHKKKGELKFILLTHSEASGEFMLRFVCRSQNALPRIQQNLAQLLHDFPALKVVSVNLQPHHMARLEGEEELFLTEQQFLTEQFNDVPLVIRPKSFFQTNPKVAEKLYATARAWAREIQPSQMWDLFCGVGGFALHCVSQQTAVTGIEIEPEAINSAQHSAALMGIHNLNFAALDSAQFSLSQAKAPELILVNPPRRGLGKTLVNQLVELAPQHLIYSSCQPETLLTDLQAMPNYQIVKMQWFDMFPHTEHMEVLVLLKRHNTI